MTFLATGLAAQDTTFKLRVSACIYKLAQDVLNEWLGTENHDLRAHLARGVIANPNGGPLDRFTWLCASNTSIAATVTQPETGGVEVAAPDGDLEFVCASNWDVIADWYWNGSANPG